MPRPGVDVDVITEDDLREAFAECVADMQSAAGAKRIPKKCKTCGWAGWSCKCAKNLEPKIARPCFQCNKQIDDDEYYHLGVTYPNVGVEYLLFHKDCFREIAGSKYIGELHDKIKLSL